MPISAEPAFRIEPADSPIAQVVANIVVEPDNDGDPEPIGTGVFVCGNLVLTAKHSIDYILRKYGGPSADGTMPYAIRLYNILPGPEYAVWQVDWIKTSTYTDLALLRLNLHGYSGDNQPGPNIGAHLRALMPAVGDRVAGFGYHSTTAVLSRNTNGGPHLDLNGVPQTSTGSIMAIHPAGRDRGMYSFPCFEVNARFDAGMSGGPVFSEHGQLIGIVSGNLAPDGDGEHVSYVSAVWPMLEMRIDRLRPGSTPEEIPVLQLAAEGIIGVADFAAYIAARPTLPAPLSLHG